MGYGTGQHTHLVRGMQEGSNKELISPERSCMLNMGGHQGGEGGGGPLTQQRAPTVHLQGPGGYPHIWQRALLATP